MDQNLGGELRAFVLTQLDGHSSIVDLLLNFELTLGRGPDVNILIDDPEAKERHASLLWDGKQITLRLLSSDAKSFLNGEPVTDTAVVRPGDEINIGRASMVVSITVAPVTQGRRSLTHPEFCERLNEELARASLRALPTSLVMLKTRTGDGSFVASAALSSFRGGDVVGTYAHDEIEFLLPDTPPTIARAVIERLLETSSGAGTAVGLAVAPDDGDSAERLMRAARDALALSLKDGTGISRPEPDVPESVEPPIHSRTTRAVVDDITKAAKKPAPVLMIGEPNSGKRHFARLFHDRSARKNSPFIIIPCAGLLDDAAVAAAFGADGKLDDCTSREAVNGTLVLDEIGDLPFPGQQRLLAMLELEKPNAYGLVSTTHRDLNALSAAGVFVEALYNRISQQQIGIPALRQRAESIVPLAMNFAAQYTADKEVKLSDGAVEKMRGYTWPGNVLELQNAVERAVKLAGGGEILAEHLPGESIDPAGRGQLRKHVGSVERDTIIKSLADNNYNQTHTAKQLGISRRALIYKMEKYGLKPPPSSSKKIEE